MKSIPHIACRSCSQQDKHPFPGLDARVAAILDHSRTTQHLAIGQTLFLEGSPGHSVHCVRSGLLKLYKMGFGGEQMVMRFCGPGELFGVRSALADEPHETTAEAVADSVVCSYARVAFDNCIARSPEMAVGVLRQLAVEVRVSHERLMALAYSDVEQRTARMLLNMPDHLDGRSPSHGPGREHIKRMDLASMIGTSPESLSRALHVFKGRGIISVTPDSIRVLDPAKLRAIARLPASPEAS